MLIAVVVLLIGLGLLTVAADQFVLGAARVAAHFKISLVVVGAVIVGFGTSAPELLVSSIAAGRGELDLGVGNVVGSNVANLTLVLGAAALIKPLTVESGVLRREAPLSIVSVLVFGVFVQGGLNRIEGIVMLVALVLILGSIMVGGKDDSAIASEAEEFLDADTSPKLEMGRLIVGLAGTVIGAQALVWGAGRIADEAGWTGGFVGFTIVAIGTSLPELVTSVAAVRRNETDLVIGNLLGSNLFNSFAVGGAISLIGPGLVGDDTLTGIGIAFMAGIALAAGLFMFTEKRVVRWEGAVLLIAYAVSIVIFSTSDATNAAEAALAYLRP